MVKRKPYRGAPTLPQPEALAEFKAPGRRTIRVGDRVTVDTIRVPGPSGRLRKLVGTVTRIYVQSNGTVAVDVIDPISKHVRSAYAERCAKRRA